MGLLGKLLVNGTELKIGQKLMLRGNDEITLIGEKGHQYVRYYLSNFPAKNGKDIIILFIDFPIIRENT